MKPKRSDYFYGNVCNFKDYDKDVFAYWVTVERVIISIIILAVAVCLFLWSCYVNDQTAKYSERLSKTPDYQLLAYEARGNHEGG
jgi:hypothetical protein